MSVHELFIDFKKVYEKMLYNYHAEFHTPTELAGVIYSYVFIKTCSITCMGKKLSDMFPVHNGLKQGDAELLLLV
jgi:hypothetical protein